MCYLNKKKINNHKKRCMKKRFFLLEIKITRYLFTFLCIFIVSLRKACNKKKKKTNKNQESHKVQGLNVM